MKDRVAPRHVHQHWQTSPDGRVRCGLSDCRQVFAVVCPDHQQRWGAERFGAEDACPICGGSGLLLLPPPPPEGEPESAWAEAVRRVEVVITADATEFVAALQTLQRSARLAS